MIFILFISQPIILMNQQEENPYFIKELYERKFYQQEKPKGVIEKVIAFQKKIQEPRTYRKPLYQSITQNVLLQQQSFRFKPSTNYSSHRSKRDVNSSLESEMIKGLRGQLSIKVQNKINEKRAFSRNQNRRIIDSPQEDASRLSKMDFASFLQDRKVYTSSRKRERPSQNISNRKMSMTIASNNQNNKTASKRVFIGGQDLEKAAQEYFSHYNQLKKTQEEYQKRVCLTKRQSLSRRRSGAVAKQFMMIKEKIKIKKMRQQDLIINNDLAPWKVDIENY